MAAQFAFGALLCVAVVLANGEATALAALAQGAQPPPGLLPPAPLHGTGSDAMRSPSHGARWWRDAAVRSALFTLPMYGGLHAVLRIVARHGAVAAVAVTSTRRVLTLILSFLLYPKPFTRGHAVGLTAVLGAASALSRDKAKRSKPALCG